MAVKTKRTQTNSIMTDMPSSTVMAVIQIGTGDPVAVVSPPKVMASTALFHAAWPIQARPMRPKPRRRWPAASS